MTGGAHGTLGNLETPGSTVYSGLTSFLNGDDTVHSGYPKAYINYIFLDDQFNYDSSLSGTVLAASSNNPANVMNKIALGSKLALNRNGYLYIWVSNETSGWDVYYDNLLVQYLQGPVLEENHYYPFGLTMAGISDKALKTNYSENKYRFDEGTELQNKEFADGTGLEMYDAGFRRLDPQLGRFTQIDPIADNSSALSTYQYADNNPVSAVDPMGLKAFPPHQSAGEQQAWIAAINKSFTLDDVDGTDVLQEDFGNGGGSDAESIFAYLKKLEFYSSTPHLMGLFPDMLYADAGAQSEQRTTNGFGQQVIRIQYNYGVYQANSTAASGGSGGYSVVDVADIILPNDASPVYPVGLHQFLAIVVGESGGKFNPTETKAIGSSIINRIDQASTSLYDPNWLKKISYGGNTKTNFVAIAGQNVDYNAVMGMTMGQIMSSSNPVIQAAISSYNDWGTDYSNPNGAADTGLYYWSSTSGLKNSIYNATNYIITLTAGGTTFFRPK